jgi:hypothetical protein
MWQTTHSQRSGTAKDVSDPDKAPAPVVAGPAELSAPERGDCDCGAHYQATQERAVSLQNEMPDHSYTREMAGRQIERFRVVPNLRQAPTGVPMMLNVRLAIDRIGDPQRERQAADQGVDTSRACGMAVNGLVLQRAIPGQQQAPDGGCEP